MCVLHYVFICAYTHKGPSAEVSGYFAFMNVAVCVGCAEFMLSFITGCIKYNGKTQLHLHGRRARVPM